MKIKFDVNKVYREIEILIKTSSMNRQVYGIVERIKNENIEFIGRKDDKTFIVKIEDIVRFYSDEQRVMFDTMKMSLEVKNKLYEIEEVCLNSSFIRVSKFAIVNVKRIKNIEARNGGLVINLENNEIEPISRRYVKKVKEFIGMGGRENVY
ncbi:MAG: LytTR family DNA-binding domain-containing protein [Romboutsia sp.]|uniref:LytTR family DNA-binding domain-containing protein n=1 Tax=Romboutsia sp. TaxID=1965302 RepID=UPI003F3773EB